MDETIQSLCNVIRAMPNYAYLKDKEGIFVSCNELYAKSIGFYVIQDIIGKTEYDLREKNLADSIRKSEKKLLETGQSQSTEEFINSPGNPHIVLLCNKTAIHNAKGDPVGIMCVAFDISKYKHFENPPALESIINNIPAHIFWKDKNCILLGCNDLQAKNMGFPSGKEMIGKSNYDVIWADQP